MYLELGSGSTTIHQWFRVGFSIESWTVERGLVEEFYKFCRSHQNGMAAYQPIDKEISQSMQLLYFSSTKPTLTIDRDISRIQKFHRRKVSQSKVSYRSPRLMDVGVYLGIMYAKIS